MKAGTDGAYILSSAQGANDDDATVFFLTLCVCGIVISLTPHTGNPGKKTKNDTESVVPHHLRLSLPSPLVLSRMERDSRKAGGRWRKEKSLRMPLGRKEGMKQWVFLDFHALGKPI